MMFVEMNATEDLNEQHIRIREEGEFALMDGDRMMIVLYCRSGRMVTHRVTADVETAHKNMKRERGMTVHKIGNMNMDTVENLINNVTAPIFDHILALMTDTTEPGKQLYIDVSMMTFMAGEIKRGMGKGEYGYTTHSSFKNRLKYLDRIKNEVMVMNV